MKSVKNITEYTPVTLNKSNKTAGISIDDKESRCLFSKIRECPLLFFFFECFSKNLVPKLTTRKSRAVSRLLRKVIPDKLTP